jgi:hypothetical protein
MSWKKKEKPLTPEQAIAMAKKDLAPYWFNSEPLLAAIQVPGGASVLPLNSNFVDTPWAYFFVDPTEFAGERALQIIREWYRRYAGHKVGFMIVFRAALPFMKSAPDLLKKFQIGFPAVYDYDGLYSQAFGIDSWPAVVVQNRGEEITRGMGASWTGEKEEKIQHFLRLADPGLSLPLPFDLGHAVKGHSRIDLGTVKGKSVNILGSVIELSGKWVENEDSISTSDPEATAEIHSPSPVIAVIAQAGTEYQVTKMLIESLDGTLTSENNCEGSTVDEFGRILVRVQNFGLYYLFRELPASRKNFKMTFPEAHNVPVRIYGLRFGAE